LLDQIFDFMVRDFSKFALQLYSKTSSTFLQRRICMRMVHKPASSDERFDRVLEEVYAQTDNYEMNP